MILLIRVLAGSELFNLFVFLNLYTHTYTAQSCQDLVRLCARIGSKLATFLS
jgi:hypothetical protein